MNKTRIMGLAAMAAIGAGAAYFVISEIRPRIMAAYWRQQIDAAADEKVEDLIGRIGEKDGGVSILVEALGSERESVALAAKGELFARLDQWHRLPAGECAWRMTELAERLAGRVGGFNPAGQRDAVDVAVRILDRPIKGRGINTQKYIAASEKILHVGLNAKGEYMRKKAASAGETPAPRFNFGQPLAAAGEGVKDAELSRFRIAGIGRSSGRRAGVEVRGRIGGQIQFRDGGGR